MNRLAAIALLVGGFAFPGALVWACGGHVPGPRVCSERDPCGKGKTCVLGRCRKNKTMPISTNAPLLRFEPVDLLWVDGAQAQQKGELGDRIVLGADGHADAKLYLRFAISVPPAERVQRAILNLDPLPMCDRKPGRMALEVAHIVAPWKSSELSGAERPKLGIPMRVGEASVTPPKPLRLDVTEIVKAWARHRKRYHGIALMAAGTSATGACYTSGLSYGQGPRLSVYLWPEKTDAGTKADAAPKDKPDAGEGDGGK